MSRDSHKSGWVASFGISQNSLLGFLAKSQYTLEPLPSEPFLLVFPSGTSPGPGGATSGSCVSGRTRKRLISSSFSDTYPSTPFLRPVGFPAAASPAGVGRAAIRRAVRPQLANSTPLRANPHPAAPGTGPSGIDSHTPCGAEPCKSIIMSLNRIPPQASDRIMAKDDGVLVSQGDGTVNRSEIERIVRQIVLARIGAAGRPEPPALRVDASARHLHLSQEDLETLFGPGYELKVHRPLYQEGNFAAQETVTIIGPRSRLISNLRILGPLRKKTQVELAFTDAISLGFDNLPIRLSGDTAGTPGALLMGPRGSAGIG